MSQILKINNSYINDIISSNLFLKEIITEDTIIAGGFPLAVFLKVESTNKDFLPLLLKKVTNPNYFNKELSYKDIDIWVKNNSSNQFLNNLLEEDPISPLKSGNSSVRLIKKSQWANTFSVTCGLGFSYDKEVQVIKTRYKNPEDVISKFDLNICKVAWCNGELFVSEKVMNDIRTCELSLSPEYDFGKENFSTKVYRSLRFIKYAKRYCLELSDDICKYIFQTLLLSIDESSKYLDHTKVISPVVIDHYDDISNNSHGMYHSLVCNSTFEWFSKCKNFKKEWSLFLINHPHITNIQNIIHDEKTKYLSAIDIFPF